MLCAKVTLWRVWSSSWGVSKEEAPAGSVGEVYLSQESVIAAFKSLYSLCSRTFASRRLRTSSTSHPSQTSSMRWTFGPDVGVSSAATPLAHSGGPAPPARLAFRPFLQSPHLQFAADAMAHGHGCLREIRQRSIRALRELKGRWTRVSTRLRHLQPPAI